MRFHGADASHCAYVCGKGYFLLAAGCEKAEDQGKPSPKTCHNRDFCFFGRKERRKNEYKTI